MIPNLRIYTEINEPQGIVRGALVVYTHPGWSRPYPQKQYKPQALQGFQGFRVLVGYRVEG